MSDPRLICFLCNRRFPGAKLLMKHLSNVRSHNLNQYSNFKCVQQNCGREYTNSRSFTRHLKKEHPQNEPEDWRSNKLYITQTEQERLATNIRYYTIIIQYFQYFLISIQRKWRIRHYLVMGSLSVNKMFSFTNTDQYWFNKIFYDIVAVILTEKIFYDDRQTCHFHCATALYLFKDLSVFCSNISYSALLNVSSL